MQNNILNIELYHYIDDDGELCYDWDSIIQEIEDGLKAHKVLDANEFLTRQER